MIVALVALFVALGGSAVAATLISGSRLKNRSVSGAKIKRDAIGGNEIKESRLGKVPKASRADNAASSQTVEGAKVRKFSFAGRNSTTDTVFFTLAGLTVRGHCEGNAPRLTAVTSVNDTAAQATVIPTEGSSAPQVNSTNDYDTDGPPRDLTAGKSSGTGTFVYQRRDGYSVTITYGFQHFPTLGSSAAEGASVCSMAGTAIGGPPTAYDATAFGG
jgi:hypothetical protein